MKELSNFELWVKGCKDSQTEIYPLKQNKNSESGLYQTKRQYLCGNNYYYTSPVFHVWINGTCVVSTLNYEEAYNAYMYHAI